MKTFCFQPAELPGMLSWLFACVPTSIKNKGVAGWQAGKGKD